MMGSSAASDGASACCANANPHRNATTVSGPKTRAGADFEARGRIFRLYNRRPSREQVTRDEVPCVPIRLGCLRITIKPSRIFMTSAARISAADLDAQHERFRAAFHILNQAIEDRAFPCASIAVTQGGKMVALEAFGRFTFEESSQAASTNSNFDIASVTKVVATTTMAMILYERGLLDLEAP